MPQPTSAQVHVDRPLTNISVAYIQNTDDFIADKVFPVVPVDKKSDLYFKYTKNDWFRDEAAVRPPATESAGSGYGITTGSYACEVYAFHKDVPNQIRQNADAGIDLDRDATEFVTQRLLLRRERKWSTQYFTTSVWGTDITGVASAPSTNQVYQWNDYTNSTPILDIDAGKRAVKVGTGFTANTLVLGYDVFLKLRNHPTITDRYKYTSSDSITTDMVAKLFSVDRVFVCSGVYATNVEGETAAYNFIQGKSALLCYSAPRPSLLQPSAGYTFSWTGISGGMGKSIGIKTFPMVMLDADRVEGQMAFDCSVVATDLGYFFTSIVA